MQDIKNLANRLDSLEAKFDKIAEIVILLCKNAEPNLPEIEQLNQFLSLKSLASHLEGLMRET